ncbi:MAG: hypothetical protein WAJ99_18155, partial [Candidatus Sulfotelmatobacter sp.]
SKSCSVHSAALRASQRAPAEATNENAGASNSMYLWTFQMSSGMFFAMAKGAILGGDKSEVLQGSARIAL